MKFRDMVRQAFGMKESQTRNLIALGTIGRPVMTPVNYDSFSKEGYRKNVIAFKCVSMIARSIGSIPILIYSKRAGGTPTEIEDLNHPLRVLLSRPNPIQGGSAFFESVSAFFSISGNSYIQAAGPNAGGAGVPRELWPMRPDRTKVVPSALGIPQAFEYSVNGQTVSFPVDIIKGKSPVLHIKTFNPTDDWYGMSPIEPSALGLDQHNESSRWNLSLLQNGSVPSGALVCSVSDMNPSGKLSDDQYLRLKDDIATKYSGSRNAGRPMLLEGGLDWKPMGFTPQDMSWIEGKHTSAREIALAFGVPPILLNIPGDSTFANYKEARLAFWEDTILPLSDMFFDEFNHWLCPLFGDGIYLESDKDGIEALAPKREAVWTRVQTADWLTVNEKREATGYKEYEGGDEILVPMSVTPLPALLDAADGDDDLNDEHPTGDPEEDPTEVEEGDDEGANIPDAPDASDGSAPKSRKSFNLKTQKQKKSYLKSLHQLRHQIEQRFASQIAGAFRKEGHGLADALTGIHDPKLAEFTAAHYLEKHKKDMRAVLRRNHQFILETFGNEVLKLAKSISELELKSSQTKFGSFVKHWLDVYSEPQITGIYGTTLKRVQKSINDAHDEANTEGDTVTDFSSAIKETYDGFTDSRSMLIARTETTIASNQGSLAAAKSISAPLTKEWVSVNDDRTRGDHSEVDGVSIALEDKFSVGGNDMDGPGDPSADISEIANCRCALVYSRVTSGGADESEN